MNPHESYLESIVAPPDFWVAGSWVTEAELTCCDCGEPIRPGQRIAEWQDGKIEQHVHEACVEAKAEDMRDE